MQDFTVAPFLGFQGTSILSSMVAVPIYILTKNVAAFFFFPTPSLALIICRLFGDGHSEQYEVILWHNFDLCFSNY